ncbi:ATP-binding cassette domain-containing protein [Streptococcus phocae subsp. phocae]
MAVYDHGLHHVPIIKGKELTFTYANRQDLACEVPTCHIEPGEFIVLCGKSGSGKSTFLKLLNGLIPDYYSGHYEGELSVADCQVGRDSVEEFSRHVSSVFQNPASQFFYQEVKHELVFPCENQGVATDVILEDLSILATDFAFQELLEAQMTDLSGGQKQRVAIATAIMQKTPIMVFDEPTANLDCQGVEVVKDYLKTLKATGKTIVIAEHRLHYLLDLADRFFYFDQGHLTYCWMSEELLALPDAKRQELGLRQLDLGVVKQELQAKTVGRHYDPSHDFQVKNLHVRAGKKKLYQLEHLSFNSGQVTGITGPNGLGKSQLVYYLTGLLNDPKAQITYKGRLLSAKERLEITSLVMQDVSLQLFAETVKTEINMGHDKHPQTAQVIDSLALSDLLDKHPASLSGGEQQRVMIAASVLSDKSVIIFDEPSSGLDVLQMEALAALLESLASQEKVVIVISHDDELLLRSCDSVYQMSAQNDGNA